MAKRSASISSIDSVAEAPRLRLRHPKATQFVVTRESVISSHRDRHVTQRFFPSHNFTVLALAHH